MSGTAQQPTSVPPTSRRRITIFAAVLALGLVAWLGTAWLGRSQVEVVAAEQLLTCQGTGVVVEDAIGDSEVQIPYAVVTERMRCAVHVQVHNRGPLPVRVRAVTLRLYGPDGGMRARATAREPFVPAGPPAGQPFQEDAVFVPLEPYRLGAGDVDEFSIDLVYRPPGCVGGVGWSSVPDTPAVRVSVWGIPGDRVLAGDSFGLKCVPPGRS